MSIKVRELTQKMKNRSLGLSANKATTLPNLQHLTELGHCTAAYQEHILFSNGRINQLVIQNKIEKYVPS